MDTVAAAINILGADGLEEGEIEVRVRSLVADAMSARRLIDLIPEGFGLVLAAHLAKVTLPTTFSARDAGGAWQSFPLEAEPVFEMTVRIARHMMHNGPRSIVSNICSQSAFVGTINQAFDSGKSTLDGAELSGPVLLGIPAELYL